MRISLFLMIIASLSFASCRFVAGERVRGSGNKSTEERPETGFSGVASYGSFDVYVSGGNSYAVKLEADDNILPYIETRVEGDVLTIKTKEGYNLSPRSDMKVYITAPSYTKIKSYGSGNIIGQNKVTGTSRLAVGISGSADINMEIDAPEVEADITGSGNINLSGQTKIFKCEISGSGDINAMDLMAEDTRVEIRGSGNADVYASVKLDVSVAGSGDVSYKGNANVKSSIRGSGNVQKVN